MMQSIYNKQRVFMYIQYVLQLKNADQPFGDLNRQNTDNTRAVCFIGV